MTLAPLRKTLKRALPKPIVRALASCVIYTERLAAWFDVMSGVRGRRLSDRVTLFRSMARAPIDSFGDFERWKEPTLDADAEVEAIGLGYFSIRRRTDDLPHIIPNNFARLFASIRQNATIGDTVVDAGANIGAVTVFMSRLVGENGRVIAVEMMPDTAARLRNTIALNALNNVVLVEKALSERGGEIVVATVEPGLHGQASIANPDRAGRETTTVEVETTTLEAVLSDAGDVTVLKLDLEGAEPAALRGAGRALARVRAILFESWKADGGETRAMLLASGYDVQPVDGRNFLAVRPSGS